MASSRQSKKRRKAKARGRRPADPPARPNGPGDAATAKPRREKRVPGDDRPPPIWGGIPVTQVAVLGGLVLLVLGMVKENPKLVFPGLALGSVGGLELSLREHFTGYRSHTTLLAGVVFILFVAVSFFLAELVLWQCLIVGALVAAPAFWALRRVFFRASGGLTYKVR